MHSIFPKLFCIIVKVVLRRLAFLRWTTRPPIFFDNGEMLGGKNTASVFFPFTFWRKIFFSVACLVDCKLVRYCNIDVFLLVSHYFCVQTIQIWVKDWWTIVNLFLAWTSWLFWSNLSTAVLGTYCDLGRLLSALVVRRKMYDNKDLRPFRACFLKTQVETFDFCCWVLRACGKD